MSLRFLADENFPGDAVAALRAAGHDVAWIATDSPSVTDRDVLARAASDQRIVLTFDKDFGELVFRAGLTADCGIVLFRLHQTPLVDRTRIALTVLLHRDDWAGWFSVVRSDRIRRVPLTVPPQHPR